MAVFTNGQNIGSIFGSPLVVKTTTTGTKAILQQITTPSGKVGFVPRGSAVMLAAQSLSNKVSGFVDADAAQFVASASGTDGLIEPAGLVFDDIEFSYLETSNSASTRVWQYKADIKKSLIEEVVGAIDPATGTPVRNSANTAIDFITKNWMLIGIGAVVLYLLFVRKTGKGKNKKAFIEL